MPSPVPSLYARLWKRPGRADAFREGETTPPERLLQAIWQHQRVHRNRLKTVDGRPVFILHPGFLNREAGPDFRNAVVQIAEEPACTGDVEVDPYPIDWFHHKHFGNSAYANVVLHVVWHMDRSARSPAGAPVLELETVLDSPVADLLTWLHEEPSVDVPTGATGKCAGPLHNLAPHQLETLLQQAALFRLEARAQQFKARAREAGWRQAFWEGAFRALGYKRNAWPMLRLAELRERYVTPRSTRTEILARLLGVGGLLPSDVPARKSASSRHTRQLWDCWWRERDAFSDCILPPSAWRLGGSRPANHPQRRLALASHWLAQGDLPERLQSWCEASEPTARLARSLSALLSPRSDPYWFSHYTLRSPASTRKIPLLGADRLTDLTANVVLPWLWARARQGRRTGLCKEIERRYLSWPAGSDNAVLKLARQRLLTGRGRKVLPRMVHQQGLLQIVGDYCAHSNSLCDRCPFPEVVHRFAGL